MSGKPRSMIITIDGPAGTGKSTVARRLAERLGFEFLNTGAMYRAVALACLQRGLRPDDQSAVATLATTVSILIRHQRLHLDGTDVTDLLRDEAVSDVASIVASNRTVREQLVQLQRACATGIDLVTEGRDQGTVVFPDADCKIFLTASVEERTRRRLRELQAEGHAVGWQELMDEIRQRDQRDESRPLAPLRPAADAVIIDTSDLAAEEVLKRLLQLVPQRR